MAGNYSQRHLSSQTIRFLSSIYSIFFPFVCEHSACISSDGAEIPFCSRLKQERDLPCGIFLSFSCRLGQDPNKVPVRSRSYQLAMAEARKALERKSGKTSGSGHTGADGDNSSDDEAINAAALRGGNRGVGLSDSDSGGRASREGRPRRGEYRYIISRSPSPSKGSLLCASPVVRRPPSGGGYKRRADHGSCRRREDSTDHRSLRTPLGRVSKHRVKRDREDAGESDRVKSDKEDRGESLSYRPDAPKRRKQKDALQRLKDAVRVSAKLSCKLEGGDASQLGKGSSQADATRLLDKRRSATESLSLAGDAIGRGGGSKSSGLPRWFVEVSGLWQVSILSAPSPLVRFRV